MAALQASIEAAKPAAITPTDPGKPKKTAKAKTKTAAAEDKQAAGAEGPKPKRRKTAKKNETVS